MSHPDTKTLDIVARLVDALQDSDRYVREEVWPVNMDDDDLDRAIDAASDALVAALDEFGTYEREDDALSLYVDQDFSFRLTLDEIIERGHRNVAERWRERVDGTVCEVTSMGRGGLTVRESRYDSGRREFFVAIPGDGVPRSVPTDFDAAVIDAVMEFAQAYDGHMNKIRLPLGLCAA